MSVDILTSIFGLDCDFYSDLGYVWTKNACILFEKFWKPRFRR